MMTERTVRKPRPLTAREKDVLSGVQQGQTNAEIAHALGISFETVKTYLNRLRSKLGKSSKEELADYAIGTAR